MTITLPQLAGHDRLTNSRMTSYKSCPRKHYYAYELGIRPDTDATALRLGSAVHEGIDVRARGALCEEAIAAACKGYDSTLPEWVNTDERKHAWRTEREIVANMLAGYFWYWEGQPDSPLQPAKIIASELSFDLPIRNPDTGKATNAFRVAGKIDRIVELRDGRIAVMETKTTGDSIDSASDYWRRLRIDQQISLYLLAARSLGHDAVTVLYDVLKKPGTMPRQIPATDERGLKIVIDTATGERVMNPKTGEPRQTGDTEKGWKLLTRVEGVTEYSERLLADITASPENYYARQEIPRLSSDLAEFEVELWQQQQQIREAQKSGRWFRNTSSCIGFGKCAYFDPCTSGHDFAASVPTGYVRVEAVHQELSK